MISSVQNSALSALKAFGTRVQSNGNNIANSLTDNYKKTRVNLTTTGTEGVRAQVEKVETPGPTTYRDSADGAEEVTLSNVELTEEIPELSINSNLYKANLKTLQVADEMAGELLKLKA